MRPRGSIHCATKATVGDRGHCSEGEIIRTMDGEIDINSLDLNSEVVEVDAKQLESQIIAKYNERFESHKYHQVFYPPPSGEWRVDALFPEGFFESAKLLLRGVATGEFREGIEGVAAVFLSRHYIELAIKYALFHSRWLTDSRRNAPASDVTSVGKTHDVQKLWDALAGELKGKPGLVPTGLDLNFVSEFVKEFHAVDQHNWRFRYPGQQLPVESPAGDDLKIDYAALLFNLQRAYDVLSTLDNYLIETFGGNEELEAEQDSW